MVLIKILKRKDASSVIIAVVIAMIIASFLPSMLFKLAGTIAGVDENMYGSEGSPGNDWQFLYLQPFVLMILQLVLLELLAWVYIFASSMVSSKK